MTGFFMTRTSSFFGWELTFFGILGDAGFLLGLNVQ